MGDKTHRLAACVSYCGTHYAGLQLQSGLTTVASELEQAFAHIANHSVHIYASGRTDVGVHACQQVVHFDTTSERALHKWLFGVNAMLPEDISVLWVEEVDAQFHARFSAHTRRYCYLLYNHQVPFAGLGGLCYTYRRQTLDVQRMQQACQEISGEFDCTSFRTNSCGSSTPWRRIDFIQVLARPPWVLVDIQANAFLHRMVRMLVAELIAIGCAEQSADRLKWLLRNPQVREYKPVAPAAGLHFASQSYPDNYALPLVAAEELWPYRLVSP